MEPIGLEQTLVLRLDYHPPSGIVRLSDQWQGRGVAPTSLALVAAINLLRDGREGLHREARTTIGQYLDIMDGRWAEHTP